MSSTCPLPFPPRPSPLLLHSVISHGRLAWKSYNHCFLVFGFRLGVPMEALWREIGEKWARSLFSWLLPAGSPWLTCVPECHQSSQAGHFTQPSLLGSATYSLLSYIWALSWLTTLYLFRKLYKPLWFSDSLSTHTLVNSSFIQSFSNYTNLCHLFLAPA